MPSLRYDVIIVGAGIAGPAMAYALSGSSALRMQGSSKRSKPLRILLIESKLSKPDRIVGELLQPGGVLALKKLGLETALEGIDAVPAVGYCVMRPKQQTGDNSNGKSSETVFEQVQIPYPDGHEGRSFHHGEFVSALRRHAAAATGVTILEATVSSNLLKCPHTGRILGVRARRRGEDGTEREEAYLAKLTIVATGSSNFRKAVYLPESSVHHTSTPNPPQPQHRELNTKLLGTFYGLVLPHPPESTYILPLYQHGTVILVPKAAGPILLYQIGTNETRILIDIPAGSKHSKNVTSYIQDIILPNLPTEELRESLTGLFEDAKAKNPDGKLALKSMGNPFFPAPPQGRNKTREGVLLIGDAWNQRHPLTGGGMTVALWDVVTLAREIIHNEEEIFGADSYVANGKSSKLTPHEQEWSAARWDVMEDIVDRWWWARKGYASTINILSVALWDLFGGGSSDLATLRTGCFKYFELGGECINGPVSLLSGLAPRPFLLFSHFFAVAFYSLWVMFTHARPVYIPRSESSHKENGHTNGYSNGHVNGHTNGHSNGRANGHANGHSNDHANGYANGHSNGSSKHSKDESGAWVMMRPSIIEYPALFIRSFQVFWTACVVFGPLMWTEIKWW
ncbi:SE-domain-containing protein [Serendipita vermifera]|nr:SE-domain-containing protein [Serendipita vermifera]